MPRAQRTTGNQLEKPIKPYKNPGSVSEPNGDQKTMERAARAVTFVTVFVGPKGNPPGSLASKPAPTVGHRLPDFDSRGIWETVFAESAAKSSARRFKNP
jgi:hypothetical protein